MAREAAYLTGLEITWSQELGTVTLTQMCHHLYAYLVCVKSDLIIGANRKIVQ